MSKQMSKTDTAFAARSRVAVQLDWHDRKAVQAVMRAMPKVLSADLLAPKYAAENAEMARLNPTMGHCSVASEALWHMLGGNACPYRDHWAYDTPAARARQARGEKRAKHDETHHWLQVPGSLHTSRGAMLDPTAAQYKRIRTPDGRTRSAPTPYQYGVAAGFMTRYPSARAQCVIDRLCAYLRANPAPGITLASQLQRDPQASPAKPFKAANYSDQPGFYAAALARKTAKPLAQPQKSSPPA